MSRIAPLARSRSSASQRADWLNGSMVGMPPGAARKKFVHRGRRGAAACPTVPAPRRGMRRVHGGDRAVDQPGAVEFAEDGEDAAGVVDVLDVHVGERRRHLAQHRHAAGQAVDVAHGERHPAFLRRRPAGAARCWWSRPWRCPASSRSRRRRRWRCRAAATEASSVLVPAVGEVDDGAAGFQEQPLAVGVGGERGAVAGQPEAERLDQAVHRVGGEHARAGAAGRAGRALHRRHFGIASGRRRRRPPWRRSGRRRGSCPCSTTLPASIGPPETKMVGMLRRSAAISMPGVILSQLEMQTSASAQWALTMYSTPSAISSREGRL